MKLKCSFTIVFLNAFANAQQVDPSKSSTISGFQCGQCELPKCLCPSKNPPGNLDPKKVPQFITLTFDDSVNQPLWAPLQTAISNRTRNPNGCPLSATFFVSTQFTDYSYVNGLFAQGHEIAVHTMNHVFPIPGEIVGAHSALNAYAGIPNDKLTGFRTPFLNYSTASFSNVHSTNKFLYDSSIEHFPTDSGFWPYTLDHGVPVTCGAGTCEGNFKFPGLWEVPLYSLLNPDGSINAAMDPNPVGAITYEKTLELLKSNFLQRYNGNRLPLGIYLHAAFMVPDAIRDFIEWTQNNYQDVYWVNNQQLLAWMVNPTDVSGSLTNPALDCLLPAVDPSNQEVCDGTDNNGDGNIDEPNLVNSCQYPDQKVWFRTCFNCPQSPPSVAQPVPPPQNNGRKTIVNSCPNGGTFDPVTGNCLALKRIQKQNLQGPKGGSTGTPSANGNQPTLIAKIPYIAAFLWIVILALF